MLYTSLLHHVSLDISWVEKGTGVIDESYLVRGPSSFISRTFKLSLFLRNHLIDSILTMCYKISFIGHPQLPKNLIIANTLICFYRLYHAAVLNHTEHAYKYTWITLRKSRLANASIKCHKFMDLCLSNFAIPSGIFVDHLSCLLNKAWNFTSLFHNSIYYINIPLTPSIMID